MSSGTEDGPTSDDLPQRGQLESAASSTGHRPLHGDDDDDPLAHSDPWAGGPSRESRGNADEVLPQGIPSFGRRRGQPTEARSFAQVTLPAQDQGTSQRIIHDVPPVWDGKDPDNQAEPYLKLLRGWLQTTRTQRTQAGMTILHYAYGDLKILINELDIDELTSATSGETVFKHVLNTYKEYLQKKLPKAMEQAIFDDKGNRHGGESMLQYTSKKRTLLKKLDKAECLLPSTAKGYLLLRGAKLSDRAWDMVETWLQGSYEENDVIDALKKLERPIPGRGGATHLCGFVDGDPAMHTGNNDAGIFYGDSGSAPSGSSNGASLVFMTESLFLIPECFDDEDVMDEVSRYIDDPDVIFVAGDLAEDLEFLEDEAVSIFANYGQVIRTPVEV